MSGVVTLIKEDHQKLESVFKKLEKAEPTEIPDLLRQVQELLVPHSRAEEQVVYPAIKSMVPDESSDVDDGLEEHHHVEQTLQELLASDPGAPGVDGLIAAMIGEVRHHVEEEEQDLLPVLSEKADDEEREELGTRFAEETGNGLAVAATKEELYEEARHQDVPGRSTMTKDELAEAVDQP